MSKFKMNVTLNDEQNTTARVCDGNSTATPLAEADVGKFVKLVGDSCFGLCASGDEIEGLLAEVMAFTQDGYAMGGFYDEGRVKVTFDGLQATPGTGVLAAGDFVVCGTVVPRATSLSYAAPKVCKATAAPNAIVHTWRVVSILSGTGDVGSIGVIEEV